MRAFFRCLAAVSLGLAAATAALVGLARLAGHDVMIVVSGSTAPAFHTGSAVLVSDPDDVELRPGMVVAFHAPGRPQQLTTHRIHSVRPRPEGLFIQTKGDANTAPDPDFTPVSSVVGVLMGSVDKAGYWLSFAQSPVGRLVLFGLPLVSLIVEELAALRRRPPACRPVRRFRRLGPRAPDGLPVRPPLARFMAAPVLLAVLFTGRSSDARFTDISSVGGNTIQTTSFCPVTYASTIDAGNPFIWYRLGELSGTTAGDSASPPHNGTYQGSPTLGVPGGIACDSNRAVAFNGTSQYVSNATSVWDPTQITLEVWFKTTTGGGKLIGLGSSQTGSSSNYDRHLYMTDAGKIVFGVYDPNIFNPHAVTITSPSTYLDGAWHYAAATFEGGLFGGGMKLYIDGALVGSNSNTASQSYTGYWRVGYDNLSGWPSAPSSYYFNGTLDEPAIYHTDLSAAAIANHHNVGRG